MESPPALPQLTIEPAGWTLPVAAGQSLLEAAQLAGIRLARSCRNGSCRACLCRRLAGSVRYRIEWPGLSREEQAEGWLLPCVAEAEGDVVIDAPKATRVEPAAADPDAAINPAPRPPAAPPAQ